MGRVEDLKKDSHAKFLHEINMIATVNIQDFSGREKVLSAIEELLKKDYLVYRRETVRTMTKSLYEEFNHQFTGEDIGYDPLAFRAREILSRLLEISED